VGLRDLLFAGRCLTEDPEKLATAAPELVSGILQRLVVLEVSDEKRIGSRVKQEIFEILCWLKETAFETETLEQLKGSEKQVGRWHFLHLQALLGEKAIAISRLLLLLQHEDSLVRYGAADVLGTLGDRSEQVISGLLLMLQHEKSSVRSSAVFALGNLGDRSEQVIAGLLLLLQDENSDVRSKAADALGKLGKSIPTFQSTLTQWIEQHFEFPHLGSAIDVLWQTCA
jgi:hypothetical protein